MREQRYIEYKLKEKQDELKQIKKENTAFMNNLLSLSKTNRLEIEINILKWVLEK